MLAGDDVPRFSLAAVLKDLELEHGSAEALGRTMPVLDTVLPAIRKVADRGFGDRDCIVAALSR